MNFEITRDQEYIKYCLTHPYVWRNSYDDAMKNVDPELFFPPMNGMLYVRAGDYGLFVCDPRNSIMYEVHTMLLPLARGMAVDISRGAIEWVFENTKCLKLITSVPSYNVLAKRLSIKSGMKLIGNNEKSFLKDGILYDQYIYGLSKGDVCHYQH